MSRKVSWAAEQVGVPKAFGTVFQALELIGLEKKCLGIVWNKGAVIPDRMNIEEPLGPQNSPEPTEF
jgi:hypothetical protein